MIVRKFRSDGITEEVLSIINELGMVTRRSLSDIIYTQGEDGTIIPYSDKPVALSRAVDRLRKGGLIEELTHDGKKYLTVTDLGKAYCREYGLPMNNTLAGLSAHNAEHRKIIVANSEAITFARSSMILALPTDKPNYAVFAAAMGALTVFKKRENYTQEELLEDLGCGICYTKKEIRDEYGQSSVSNTKPNNSRKIGAIFDMEGVTFLYKMSKKSDVLTTRSEVDFDHIIKNDFEQFYRQNGEYHVKAYILVPTMNYLPTFFHGSVDGIDAKNELAKATDIQGAGPVRFKIDKLPLYEKIYMLPVGDLHVNYRKLAENYTDADYEYDKTEFEKKHPGETNVIMCRFPELVQLRKAYINHDYCTLVGPGDDKTVDLLSRCMRNRLIKYYDINTGKEIKFKRYNSKGLPLVGNTNQIDYDAPWKLGGKFTKKEA